MVAVRQAQGAEDDSLLVEADAAHRACVRIGSWIVHVAQQRMADAAPGQAQGDALQRQQHRQAGHDRCQQSQPSGFKKLDNDLLIHEDSLFVCGLLPFASRL